MVPQLKRKLCLLLHSSSLIDPRAFHFKGEDFMRTHDIGISWEHLQKALEKVKFQRRIDDLTSRFTGFTMKDAFTAKVETNTKILENLRFEKNLCFEKSLCEKLAVELTRYFTDPKTYRVYEDVPQILQMLNSETWPMAWEAPRWPWSETIVMCGLTNTNSRDVECLDSQILQHSGITTLKNVSDQSKKPSVVGIPWKNIDNKSVFAGVREKLAAARQDHEDFNLVLVHPGISWLGRAQANKFSYVSLDRHSQYYKEGDSTEGVRFWTSKVRTNSRLLYSEREAFGGRLLEFSNLATISSLLALHHWRPGHSRKLQLVVEPLKKKKVATPSFAA